MNGLIIMLIGFAVIMAAFLIESGRIGYDQGYDKGLEDGIRLTNEVIAEEVE